MLQLRHTGIVATSAGLLCVHHQHLDIYGSSVADAGACVLGVGFAATTGIARIVNDRHYATDVLAGFVVGAAAGYVLPLFRFYHARAPGLPAARAFTVIPMVSPSIAGVAAIGTL